MGRPQDIASTVAFLLSDEAAWMTGQVVSVNGGFGVQESQVTVATTAVIRTAAAHNTQRSFSRLCNGAAGSATLKKPVVNGDDVRGIDGVWLARDSQQLVPNISWNG